MADAPIDPKWYRQVLGQYPTGVSVITAMHPDGSPTGMVVGSFTSVSLDPPLVAFFPDRNSGSWARLRECPNFCVNILSAEQEDLCRKLASKDPDKFATVGYRASPLGSPVLDGVVAWIDCRLEAVEEAGDHFIVLGRVQELEIATGGLPLLFFQGGYGRFAPSSIMASDTHGLLTEQLRIIDRARPEMERIAVELAGQCVASTRVGDELIVAASAGQAADESPGVLVGQRLPFAPPLGATFAAWLPPAEVDRWIGGKVKPAEREAYLAALTTVRERGFAVAQISKDVLRSFRAHVEAQGQAPGRRADLEQLVHGLELDPAHISAELSSKVRIISVPVFDAGGNVVLSLTLQGFRAPLDDTAMAAHVARLLQGTQRISAGLGGREP